MLEITDVNVLPKFVNCLRVFITVLEFSCYKNNLQLFNVYFGRIKAVLFFMKDINSVQSIVMITCSNYSAKHTERS